MAVTIPAPTTEPTPAATEQPEDLTGYLAALADGDQTKAAQKAIRVALEKVPTNDMDRWMILAFIAQAHANLAVAQELAQLREYLRTDIVKVETRRYA